MAEALDACRDGLTLARLLAVPGAPASVEAPLRALIAPYLSCMSQRAIIRRLEATDRAGRFARDLEAAAVHFFVPALKRRLGAVAAGTLGAGHAPECAEALRTIVSRLFPGAEAPLAARHLEEAARPLTEAAAAEAAEAGRALAGDDYPELAPVAWALLRLDAMAWLLGELGAAARAEDVSRLARRLALQAVERITATTRRFVDDPNQLTLFDNAAVVARADDTAVILSVAFVSGPDDPGYPALAAYARHLPVLADALSGAARRMIGRPASNLAVFGGLIQQMECLALTCTLVSPDDGPREFKAFREEVRHRWLGLADALASALDRAGLENPPDAAGLAHTRAQAGCLTGAARRLSLTGFESLAGRVAG